MTPFATSGDYANYVGSDAPTNVTGLLRAASLLVAEATKTDYYATDDDGVATDETIKGALRDATCAQAAAWAALKVNPLAGGALTPGVVVSKNLDGAGVGYADGKQASQARADSVRQLVPDARRILEQAGLASLHVWAYG